MSDDIVENLKQPSQWLRIAFMIALAIALHVASIVLTLLIIAQALFSLVTGRDNSNLRALGKDLGTYVLQILEFLTYNSEHKPFPFSAYPGSDEPVPPEAEPAPANEASAKKAAPRPSPAKKTAKKTSGTASKPAAKKATTPKAAGGIVDEHDKQSGA